MKRRARETLTGGTGDVNPQFFSGSAVQSAADTATTTSFTTPVTRIPGADVATIIEVIKIFGDFTEITTTAVGEVSHSITVNFSTVNFGTTATAFSDSRIFGILQKQDRSAFTAGGTFRSYAPPEPYVFDCTDGAGHGILIATDNFFVQVLSSATGVVNTCNFKILYRFKEVGMLEYIGIVQSQQ